MQILRLIVLGTVLGKIQSIYIMEMLVKFKEGWGGRVGCSLGGKFWDTPPSVYA